MFQKLTQTQTLKQQLNLNQNLLDSIDFLNQDAVSIVEKINAILESNPFLESHFPSYDDDFIISNACNKPSLYDNLNQQLILYPNEYNHDIMNYLILSLNHHGFLSYDEKTYVNDLQITMEEWKYHLDILQSLEPTGIGAKDAIDSICIQLKKKGFIKACQLLQEYRELILSMNYKNIKQSLHLNQNEINELYNQIRSCQPFPYSSDSKTNQPILADISITVENHQIQIEPISSYHLSLNHELFNQVKEDQTMKKYFNEANFLIENLNKRNQTVLIVANELVNIQKGYFLFQDELYPCSLKDLAKKTGFHESTISRTLHNKYFLYHNEIFPLKDLMVSQTKNGDSSDSIKKAITIIISNENLYKPFSDEQIVKKLEEIDLVCSRRTVTKYREQLHIPSSSKRKKHL